MISIGLDLSLTKTGYAILKGDGTVISSGLVKSKPVEDNPVAETRRIVGIVDDIFDKIFEALDTVSAPNIVAIEGLAYGVKHATALTQLAALNYIIRMRLVEMEWPFVIVAPTSLKKFITGSGNGDKDRMMMVVFKDYGFEALDNNVNDAYALSIVGLSVLNKALKNNTQPQSEVVALLKKQLVEY